MKLYIASLLEGSLEWEQSSEEEKKGFEEYLNKYFEEHKDQMDVPMTFREWIQQKKAI